MPLSDSDSGSGSSTTASTAIAFIENSGLSGINFDSLHLDTENPVTYRNKETPYGAKQLPWTVLTVLKKYKSDTKTIQCMSKWWSSTNDACALAYLRIKDHNTACWQIWYFQVSSRADIKVFTEKVSRGRIPDSRGWILDSGFPYMGRCIA